MGRVWSVDLPNHVGRHVVIAGWLLRLRRLSQVSFLIVRDGRGTMQAVLDDPALIEQVAALPAESVLRLEGEVVNTPQAPRGVELRGEKIEVISEASAPPPFELHQRTAGSGALRPLLEDLTGQALDLEVLGGA